MCPILPLPTTTTLARRLEPLRAAEKNLVVALRGTMERTERIDADASMIGI